MTDMLVKLYQLPPLHPVLENQTSQGITIRRGIVPEKHLVLDWVEKHFSPYWRSECDAAYSRLPVSCFLAIYEEKLVGFGCYDATGRGFFGPTGVDDSMRGKGVGKALLLMCLHDMYSQGYGYCVIGGVGPVEFYQKVVGATLIDDSTPGIYGGMLRPEKNDI